MNALILLISAGDVKRCGIGGSFLFAEDEGAVCRTEQSVCAGDGIKFIVSLLFACVMDDKHCYLVAVGKRFQLCDYIVITAVAVIRTACLSNTLEGVDYD